MATLHRVGWHLFLHLFLAPIPGGESVPRRPVAIGKWLQNKGCRNFRALIARPDCDFRASKMPFGAVSGARRGSVRRLLGYSSQSWLAPIWRVGPSRIGRPHELPAGPCCDVDRSLRCLLFSSPFIWHLLGLSARMITGLRHRRKSRSSPACRGQHKSRSRCQASPDPAWSFHTMPPCRHTLEYHDRCTRDRYRRQPSGLLRQAVAVHIDLRGESSLGRLIQRNSG